MSDAQPPVFAEQSAMAGKVKGRKRKTNPAEETKCKAPRKEQQAENKKHKNDMQQGQSNGGNQLEGEGSAPSAKKPEKAKPKAKGKGKAKARGKKNQQAGDADAGSTDLADQPDPNLPSREEVIALGGVPPPEHVTANHIYSNAYRKTLTKPSADKAQASSVARKATALFRAYGLVLPDDVGKFMKTPRGARACQEGKPEEAAAQPVAEPQAASNSG